MLINPEFPWTQGSAVATRKLYILLWGGHDFPQWKSNSQDFSKWPIELNIRAFYTVCTVWSYCKIFLNIVKYFVEAPIYNCYERIHLWAGFSEDSQQWSLSKYHLFFIHHVDQIHHSFFVIVKCQEHVIATQILSTREISGDCIHFTNLVCL